VPPVDQPSGTDAPGPGSTPDASTMYKRQTRLSGVILREDGFCFSVYYQRLRLFSIFFKISFCTIDFLPSQYSCQFKVNGMEHDLELNLKGLIHI
jgi:hypothetical protein